MNFFNFVSTLPLAECAPLLQLTSTLNAPRKREIEELSEWAAARLAQAERHGPIRAIGPNPCAFDGASYWDRDHDGTKTWVFLPWKRRPTAESLPWRGDRSEHNYRRVFRHDGLSWRYAGAALYDLRRGRTGGYPAELFDYIVAGDSIRVEEWWKVWCSYSNGRSGWATSQQCPKPGHLYSWQQWFRGDTGGLSADELLAVFGAAA